MRSDCSSSAIDYRSLTLGSSSGTFAEIFVKFYTVATNLPIDPELLEKALKIGGEKTKRETVNKALREFIARREQRRLREIFGKLDWDDSYDHKAERSRM